MVGRGGTMTPMTDAAAPTVPRQIIAVLVDRYQRYGYQQVAIPARTLLSLVDREDLEPALASLLDAQELVPVGTNGVALHPSARIALLSRAVLDRWLDLEDVTRLSMVCLAVVQTTYADYLTRVPVEQIEPGSLTLTTPTEGES